VKVANSRISPFASAALLCTLGGALFCVSSASKADSTTLTISGTPSASVNVSGHYSFQPVAKDTVRSRIKFNIYNKPVWASFDETTGRLWGQPTRRDIGTYKDIKIRLTDWYGYVTLPAFSIAVVNASATTPTPPSRPTTSNVALDWTPPTENTDGSVLTNLAGYVVHYGTSANSLTNTIKLPNAGLTSYVVDNLTAGTWYFTVSSYTSAGVESSQTGVISTTL
jgi:hypothetical protein